MNILLMGQCTLHWGRMEFGNIGNYYIIEPFVRELHRVFPGATIKTTFQMSERFCKEERIEVLPMDYYFGWNGSADLDTALEELAAATVFKLTGKLPKSTGYINAVLEADLVIDFSGDIWGDNADFLGDHRFFIGLCKDRVAQLLGKKTVMLAGSPGPFHTTKYLPFAQEVFEHFDLVTNRESISMDVLKEYGFNTSKTKSLTCPAFLFEPGKEETIRDIVETYRFQERKNVVGFIVCGWNFLEGPFDKWPRDDKEYLPFAEAVEFIEKKLGADVCLMSHSNGFDLPPKPFQLIHGRDYPVIKQLQSVLDKRGIAQNYFALDGIYDTWTTKAIIRRFDMLVSGRVHAAVAGLSQCVPTVVIDYGHEPKAHKLRGFAKAAGMEHLVANPEAPEDLIQKITTCWNNRAEIKNTLEKNIPEVKKQARQNFELLKEIMS